jgi:hypothetical protein
MMIKGQGVTESRKTNATKTHKKHAGRSNWDEGYTNDNCNKSMNKYKINHCLSFQIIYIYIYKALFLAIRVAAGGENKCI